MPVAGSMKGLGSMEPPKLAWHSSGPPEVSVNTGVGVRLAAVATDRQLCPVPAA